MRLDDNLRQGFYFFLWTEDMNEVVHLFGNTLVVRDLLNIKFKIGIKKKALLFKKIAEMLSVPGDVIKLIFRNSLNISI